MTFEMRKVTSSRKIERALSISEAYVLCASHSNKVMKYVCAVCVCLAERSFIPWRRQAGRKIEFFNDIVYEQQQQKIQQNLSDFGFFGENTLAEAMERENVA